MALPEDEQGRSSASIGETYISKYIGASRDPDDLRSLYKEAFAEAVSCCERLLADHAKSNASGSDLDFSGDASQFEIYENDRKRAAIVEIVQTEQAQEATVRDLLATTNDAIESIERLREHALADRLRTINGMVELLANIVPEMGRLRTKYGQADVRIVEGRLEFTIDVRDHGTS